LEFSTAAGDRTGSLEELAAGTQLAKAAPILDRLETIAHELVKQIDRITVEALRRQAEGLDEHPKRAAVTSWSRTNWLDRAYHDTNRLVNVLSRD
jgi:hypothetical protein